MGEERELRDIISATKGAEDQALEHEEDESVEEGSSGEGNDTALEDSVEEGVESDETTIAEPDEDESDQSVEPDSEDSDEGSEVDTAEESSDATESEENDDYIDEDSLPITRVATGPRGGRASITANKNAPIREMMAMTLTIRNKINGQYHIRPSKLKSTDKWEVEHALSEIQDPQRIATLYQMSLDRRERANNRTVDLNKDSFNSVFLQRIKNMNQRGREWRKQQSIWIRLGRLRCWMSRTGRRWQRRILGYGHRRTVRLRGRIRYWLCTLRKEKAVLLYDLYKTVGVCNVV